MISQGQGGHHGPGVGEDQIVRPGEIHLGLDGIRAVESTVEDEPAEAVGCVDYGDELVGASNLVDYPVALTAKEDLHQGHGRDGDGADTADYRSRSHGSIIANLLVDVVYLGITPEKFSRKANIQHDQGKKFYERRH
jgi:hypothetical protein